MPGIDWGAVEDFAPMPADLYRCTISGHEYTEESKSSGEPMSTFEFTVNGGEYEGRKLWRNFSWQPKALPFLKKFLIRVGNVNPDRFAGYMDTETFMDICADVIGQECLVDVGVREYQGELTNEVKNIRPAGY